MLIVGNHYLLADAGKIRVCYRIDVVNIVIFREMVLSREKYFTMPLFSLKMQYL